MANANLTGQNPDGNFEIYLAHVPLATQDMSGRVRIRREGLQRLGKGRFQQTIYLRARGKRAVYYGPMALVLTGLPPGVQLLNGSGLTDDQEPLGRPFRLLPLKGNRLTGKKEMRVTLKFYSAPHLRPRFTVQLLYAANPL
jgi:hypothetical protein